MSSVFQLRDERSVCVCVCVCYRPASHAENFNMCVCCSRCRYYTSRTDVERHMTSPDLHEDTFSHTHARTHTPAVSQCVLTAETDRQM